MKTLTALLMLSVALPMPAYAQDPEPDPVAEATKLETARVEARTSQVQAQTALVQAQAAALGLTTDATGKTTLHEKGGELEAWMLSAQAIDEAAKAIGTAANTARGGSKVVLLAGAEAFDLSVYTVVKTRIDAIATRFEAIVGQPPHPTAICPAGGAKPVKVGIASVGAVAALAGALIGAIKTDTDIYAADGPNDARLLVNAIAQRQVGAWIVPSDLSQISQTSPLARTWDVLTAQRAAAATCALALGKDETKKAELARVTEAIAAFDDFEAKAVQGDGGTSLLVQAIRAEALATGNPLIMRVFIEKAGGTILLRKNLWTALGAPAVGITGAAVVSWRLVDPRTGDAKGGGMLICRTALTNLRAIQNGPVGSKACPALAD